MDNDTALENVARQVHEIWREFFNELFASDVVALLSDDLLLPQERVARWRMLARTPYEDLPFSEQDLKRSQARSLLRAADRPAQTFFTSGKTTVLVIELYDRSATAQSPTVAVIMEATAYALDAVSLVVTTTAGRKVVFPARNVVSVKEEQDGCENADDAGSGEVSARKLRDDDDGVPF